MLHVRNLPRVTAGQIEENCPAELDELGKCIAAHLDKATRCDQKANDHRIAAGQLLAQAKERCDEGGFAAFHKRFCPTLSRSRTYELLAIASGKKTLDQSRAVNAERNRKYRADKKRPAAEIVHHMMESGAKPVAVTRPPTTAEQAQGQVAKAEAERAKAVLQTARAEAVARMFGPETKRIPAETRRALIDALGALASEQAEGRARAALVVEAQRACLNLPWAELIVPAEVEAPKLSGAA